MEKKIVIKIIGVAIIFTFAMSFLQVIIPSQASAATSGLNWDNPNKSGNTPYKFKPQDALNSQLIMQVVGCTGVVDKISNALSGLFKTQLQNKIEDQELKTIIAACKGVKGGTLTTTASTTPGTEVTTAVDYIINCGEIQNAKDDAVRKEIVAAAKKADTTKRTSECFNGIAVTLARNQLTSMTRYTMNWVNSGFNGDPMYVRDITSFTNKLEQNVLETGIDILTSDARAYPYGSAFARSAINNYKYGNTLASGATNFLDSLTSSLENFVTDPNSYYSETALERAQRANETFANDFSSGGWDAWLGLTQIDQNNPLGFAMQASQYVADQQAEQVRGIQNELLTNNGFLSQKKCVWWRVYDVDGNPKALTDELNAMGVFVEQKNKPQYGKCLEYEVVTPGSLIKDQVSEFVNSPVRQLELADTINESLNALFSALIGKFQNQGLSSISPEKYEYGNDNMGLGIGDNSSTMFGESDLGGGFNGAFDLTRDLGNIYIHNYQNISQGNWDAKNNVPELNIGVSPFNQQGLPLANVYYTVSVAGNTKLINEGYNGWAIDDKAFWDGKEWQNWKKGTPNPIEKRGVIQIQKDYVVAAKELLANLPNIMPKIGELDYCIPGPNPSWQANSGDAYTGFIDYAYSLSSEYKNGSFLKRDSTSYSVAQPGDKEHDDYKAIFDDTTPSLWTAVTQAWDWMQLIQMGNTPRLKNNDDEEIANGMINSLLTNISSKLQEFNKQYSLAITNLYGRNSLMQKPYLENERTSAQDPNPAYLPMAETGLNITKDILSYNDDIATMTQDYKDSIVQANSNIYKLNKIKDEVSLIIQAAQKLRNDNMIRILNEEATRNGTSLMTEAQYNAKYASCLDEENITFYDDTDIMSSTGGEEGRCSDGLDNDLNGLIDMRDPICSGETGTNTGSTTGAVLPTYYYPTKSCSGNQTYSTGPHLSGTYSSGARVQGGSGIFYVVVGGPQTSPISGAVANIMTSGTGATGCPL